MSTAGREQNRTERAAAVRAEQARKERNRRIALIAAIVVILGAIVAAGSWYSSGSSSEPPSATAPVRAGEGSILVGKASAPVKVVIYEDFLCPYCRELEDSTRDFLRENAAQGKVQVEYRPINLLTDYSYSARSLNAWAAVLAHGTPQQALELHDLLYEHQPYETASDNTSDADIAALVAKAGADNAKVEAALKVQDTAFFAAAQKAMVSAGIRGTPTVLIDGEQQTGSVQALVAAIEAAVS
jgi:protein-disulfide isomerase